MRFHFLAVSAIIWILLTGTGYARTFTGGVRDNQNTITFGVTYVFETAR
jgi:hypothetical protein